MSALTVALVASLIAGSATGILVVRASGSLGTGLIVVMSLVVAILSSWFVLGTARIVGGSAASLDRAAAAVATLACGSLLGFFVWTGRQEDAMTLRLRDYAGLSGSFAGVLLGIAVQWRVLRRSRRHVSVAGTGAARL